MAFVLGDRPVRPLTVDEVMRMLEAGVFEDPQRLELLLGVLTEKAVKSPAHVEVKARLRRWLRDLEPDVLRIEDPLVAPDGISMPEPDLAIVEPSDYRTEHPSAALFVIEVALTSLKLDTTVKPPLYAAAGVPDYWVVDVANHRVLVYRDPRPDGYAHTTTHTPPGTLEPLNLAVKPLDLTALFQGLAPPPPGG